MTLSVRPIPFEVPAYSLTGDLLSFLTCGLQYRYQNRGALPPSKPVQLWFGQFIHGVLEEAYLTWRQQAPPFPWGPAEIDNIVQRVERRLSARGVHFQRFLLLGIAVERAYVAINEWGPLLFPLIAEAEVRLQGIRAMPQGTVTIRQSQHYEVAGVVDVISSVRFAQLNDPNPIADAVLQAIVGDTYEVIVDYKGMRRPPIGDPNLLTYEHHEWQVRTYAWLREQQLNAGTVRCGILLYLNELVPSREDMQALYAEVHGPGPARTDQRPISADAAALRDWPQVEPAWRQQMNGWQDQVRDWWRTGREQGAPFPRRPALPAELSMEYRRHRSMRVIPVDAAQVQFSLHRFDQVVSEIEGSVAQEARGQPITGCWAARPIESTCTVCDFRKFCPAQGNQFRGPPQAP